MKAPLKLFEDLPNNYAQTNIAFSPDEQLFLTGTSVERESTTGGLLCFFDRTKLELVSKVGVSPTLSVVQCLWHQKLNQVSSYGQFLFPLIDRCYKFVLQKDHMRRSMYLLQNYMTRCAEIYPVFLCT